MRPIGDGDRNKAKGDNEKHGADIVAPHRAR